MHTGIHGLLLYAWSGSAVAVAACTRGCRTNHGRWFRLTTGARAGASGAPLTASDRPGRVICLVGVKRHWCPTTNNFRCARFVRQPHEVPAVLRPPPMGGRGRAVPERPETRANTKGTSRPAWGNGRAPAKRKTRAVSGTSASGPQGSGGTSSAINKADRVLRRWADLGRGRRGRRGWRRGRTLVLGAPGDEADDHQDDDRAISPDDPSEIEHLVCRQCQARP